MNLHPTALIDPAARLGADVTVGPYAVIGPDVELGAGCVIGPHAVLHPYTTLGPGCQVHAHAILGGLPQDLAFKECVSYVRIGAGCVFREGVTVHRGTQPDSVTEIGDGCFLMANSHVGHNVRLGKRVILANGVLLGGYVEVGDGAFLSGNVLVHQFCRIGRLVMMGGGSGVGKDVPPFCLIRPLAMNRISGLNTVGLRRAGLTPAQRLEIRRAFRLLAASDLTTTRAVARIRAEFSEGPALEMADFVASARRGICRVVDADESNAAAGDGV